MGVAQPMRSLCFASEHLRALAQTIPTASGLMLMSDEFRKRLSDAKTCVQAAKQKADQRPPKLSHVAIGGRVKAPLIKQVVRVANQELADIGVRFGTSDFSRFSPGGMSVPGLESL